MTDRENISILLQPEDSKRVADEIIGYVKYLGEKAAEKIDNADFDISAGTRYAFNDLLQPRTSAEWKKDWLPWSVEEFLDKLRDGIVSAIATNASGHRR